MNASSPSCKTAGARPAAAILFAVGSLGAVPAPGGWAGPARGRRAGVSFSVLPNRNEIAMPARLLIAKTHDKESKKIVLLPALANRHGLITGATGTGKTVTLQKMAESFAAVGVPVFMADVKGDLSGICAAGRIDGKLADVLAQRGLPIPAPRACPVTLWDVFGAAGHPVRATISDMGPLLLARMLDLNETQAGVLNLVFKIADDNGLLLLDLKDLRAMLQHVGDNAKDFTTQYGNISSASVGAMQRGLLQIETQGGDKFFGEPMLNIEDFMQTVDVNVAPETPSASSPQGG